MSGGPRARLATPLLIPPRRVWAMVGVVFSLAASIFAFAFLRLPVLYDVDGYYHLAVARAYAERGVFDTLDWARFSIMHDGFGDKDFLFHVLLMPFAALEDPTTGGFLAIAFLNALIAAAIAHASISAIGRWGVVVPLFVYGTSMDFALRMVRLRPEILSLLLILLAVSLAGTRRVKLLGVVACLYALSYTAFQALLGLCLLFFVRQLWADRSWEWKIVVYPTIGAALGLLLHPHFPVNLQIWLVQNFHFFLNVDALDIGQEVMPRTTKDALILNLGWLVGLFIMWRGRAAVSAPPGDARLRDFTLLAALVFGLLYVLMARFVTYFVPLGTLALLQFMRTTGAAPGPWVRLPWRGRAPFALAFLICILVSACSTLYFGFQRMTQSSRTFRPEMRADWEAFAKAMPDGAKVLAPWAATHEFVFWAPRASYVNVLDPVFMVARDADTYRFYMDILEGREPDIPLVAKSHFDSDFYADDGQAPYAKRRLLHDPRVVRLHDGVTYLFGFVPGRNRDFLLDWKVLPPGTPMPPSAAVVADPRTPPYPRAGNEGERAIEGYVDGRRLGDASECLSFARIDEFERPTELTLEVAPYGSAEVFVNDRLSAAVPAHRGAVLGRGVILPWSLPPGQHRLSIRTCRSGSQIGFYALVRR